jgi:splicing factor 1
LIVGRVSRWEDDGESKEPFFIKNFNLKGKRKSGWADPIEKNFTPQCFSYVPPHYTINEYEIWIRRHRVDDLQRRIAMNDWEMVDPDVRSPSPEPIYDAKTGLRMNTKEQRFRDKYVRERNSLIQEVLLMDPTYEVSFNHLLLILTIFHF